MLGVVKARALTSEGYPTLQYTSPTPTLELLANASPEREGPGASPKFAPVTDGTSTLTPKVQKNQLE